MDGYLQHNTHEGSPETTSTMVPKVIVSIDMVYSIDGDDLKELPEETQREAMVGL